MRRSLDDQRRMDRPDALSRATDRPRRLNGTGEASPNRIGAVRLYLQLSDEVRAVKVVKMRVYIPL